MAVTQFSPKATGGWMTRRSSCPSCAHVLSARELIPLVSFLLLKGRCRHCRKSISWLYPTIELATVVAVLFVGYAHGWQIDLLFVRDLIVAMGLVALFFVDALYMLLPDKLTIPLILVVLIVGFATGNHAPYWIAAAIFGFAWFAIQYILSKKKWVGSGDMRLGFLMGLILGWPSMMVGLMLAYIFGACVAVYLLLTKKAGAKSALAFGPFLIISTVVTWVWGEALLHWYLGLI